MNPIGESERGHLAIIGAGPVGLEAALYGHRLGYDTTIYEAEVVGAHIRRWGHVRMFSPWAINFSPLAAERLGSTGWKMPPPDICPTGLEYVRQFLEPLSGLPEISSGLELQTRVLSISREGLLKGDRIADPKRGQGAFRLLLEVDGKERVALADRVIDASGVFGQHNWLGSGGIPAPGERRCAASIRYRLEDYLGSVRDRYLGREILLVGAGHSAATAIHQLWRLWEQDPMTRVHWVTRSESSDPISTFDDDPLPERHRVATAANRLARGEHEAISRYPGRSIDCIAAVDRWLHVTLRSVRGEESLRVDRIIALVGQRPDVEMSRELHVHLCWATEGPMRLAATLLGEDAADCLAQSSPGPAALEMPEPGYLWLGHKAYARNQAFLIRLGLEQVRDAFRLWEVDPKLDLYRGRLPDLAAVL